MRSAAVDLSVGQPEPAVVPRVLLVGPRPTPPVRGGVEKGVDLLLHTALAARTGMRLFNNFRVRDPRRRLRERLRYMLGKLQDFRDELRAAPTDLVHVKSSSGINLYQNTLYASLARLLGYPVVFQIHCGKFEVFYRGRHPLARAWIRHTLKKSRRVIVLSEFWADRLRGIIPAARIAVVPNGLADDEIERLRETGLRTRTQILFFGTGEEATTGEKGLDDLLAVLPELILRAPGARWVLAGLPDPLRVREQVRRRVGHEVAEDTLVLRGIVEGDDRAALLRESTILVLPSHYENMPNILLEAMARGMGVVATSVGAIPEMLGAGEGGFLFAPRDRLGLAEALARLIGSPETCLAQGNRNRSKVVRDYSMSVVQEGLERVYRDAAGLETASRGRERNIMAQSASSTTPAGKS